MLAAYFFDWDPPAGKSLLDNWIGGGTMTIQRIYPDPKTNKFDLEGTKGIKMDWEMPPGGELQVHGSGELLRWLLDRDLVDELNLRIYPVIVGDGMRLFPERGQTHDMKLIESRPTSTGVMIQTYRPAGRATFGSADE